MCKSYRTLGLKSTLQWHEGSNWCWKPRCKGCMHVKTGIILGSAVTCEKHCAWVTTNCKTTNIIYLIDWVPKVQKAVHKGNEEVFTFMNEWPLVRLLSNTFWQACNTTSKHNRLHIWWPNLNGNWTNTYDRLHLSKTGSFWIHNPSDIGPRWHLFRCIGESLVINKGFQEGFNPQQVDVHSFQGVH